MSVVALTVYTAVFVQLMEYFMMFCPYFIKNDLEIGKHFYINDKWNEIEMKMAIIKLKVLMFNLIQIGIPWT